MPAACRHVAPLLAALLWCAACTRPDLPAAPSSAGQTGGAAAGDRWTVSGTVWVHGPAGAAPATGGPMFGWIETGGSGRTTGPVSVDAAGRFSFTVPRGVASVTLQRPSAGYQPCAVVVKPAGDVRVDLDVVSDPAQLGARLPAALATREPTLAGTVYEDTPEGPRRVPDAWVWLDGLHGLGSLVADTRSDDQGRFVLCDIPDKPSLVVQISAPGFALYESGYVSGGMTMDVRLRRLAGE